MRSSVHVNFLQFHWIVGTIDFLCVIR